MSPAVPLPVVSDRRSFMVIIGVDPHKRTHTASALEPGSNRLLATLQIEATLADIGSWRAGQPGSRPGGGRWRTPTAWAVPGAVAGRPRRAGRRRAVHRDRASAVRVRVLMSL